MNTFKIINNNSKTITLIIIKLLLLLWVLLIMLIVFQLNNINYTNKCLYIWSCTINNNTNNSNTIELIMSISKKTNYFLIKKNILIHFLINKKDRDENNTWQECYRPPSVIWPNLFVSLKWNLLLSLWKLYQTKQPTTCICTCFTCHMIYLIARARRDDRTGLAQVLKKRNTISSVTWRRRAWRSGVPQSISG